MNSLTLLILFCVLLFFVIKKFGKNKNNKSPPGPYPWPIIGNILSLGKNQTLGYCKLADKYGEMYKFKLGPLNCLVLNDPSLIRQAYSEVDFSGRSDMKVFTAFSNGKIGIIAAEGNHWEEQRRFTLRHLRDFGFGKSYMEDLVMEEVKEVISWLKREEGKSVTTEKKLALAVVNALWTIMTGNRYSHDDPKLSYIQSAGIEAVVELLRNPLAFFMEWTLEFFPNLTGWTKLQKILFDMREFYQETIDEHKKVYTKGQEPKDFVDDYLNEIDRTNNSNSSFFKEQGEIALQAVIADLFGAGSETTSSTINWAILYLITHPKVQEKYHQEIDQVIGRNRLPTLADRANMPYTEALINETLRKSSFIPQGVYHKAIRDTKLNGYHVPKNTIVIANLYYVHHNPKIWGDPEKFRPERFLSPDGKTFVKNENLMPFSAGKRLCIGENLARDELFLFLTSIFQRFQVFQDPNEPTPATEPKWRFVLHTQTFSCTMKDRIQS